MPDVAFAAVGRLEEYGQCTFLAEAAFSTGNMADIAMKILCRLPVGSAAMRRSYKYDESGCTFHFLCDSPLVFVATERGLGADQTFALLTLIQQKWLVRYGTATRLNGNLSAYRDFEPTLHELVQGAEAGNSSSYANGGTNLFSSRGSGRRDEEMEELGVVHAKLEGIKTVMADSIEKVLERGEKIELLVDKTDKLHQHAFKFAR